MQNDEEFKLMQKQDKEDDEKAHNEWMAAKNARKLELKFSEKNFISNSIDRIIELFNQDTPEATVLIDEVIESLGAWLEQNAQWISEDFVIKKF